MFKKDNTSKLIVDTMVAQLRGEGLDEKLVNEVMAIATTLLRALKISGAPLNRPAFVRGLKAAGEILNLKSAASDLDKQLTNFPPTSIN